MNPSSSVASRLHPVQRQEIAVKVLSKQEPVSQIANQEQGTSEISLPTETNCTRSIE